MTIAASENHKIRRMDAGSWYWISKKVTQEFAPRIGFLPLAVYHFFASMVNESQSCYPSQRYVAERLGCSRSSVCRAVKVLRKQRLINLTKKDRNHRIYQLLEPGSCRGETDMSHPCNLDVARVDTNNTTLTRINNNGVVRLPPKILSPEHPLTKGELLAVDIAETLGDKGGIQTYLQFASKYSEQMLREVLSQVRQMPEERIRKSRRALFIFLVHRHAS